MIEITQKVNKKIPGGTSLFVKFNYNPKIVEELKKCPVYSYDAKTHIWEVPCTSLAILLDNLSTIEDIQLTFLQRKEKEFKDFEVGPFKSTLYNYQIEGVKYGLNHDKWLLLDAPGLGKTIQLTCLAEELKKRDNIEHCLVICGINTLKSNWKREIELHSKLSSRILGERLNKRGRFVVGGIKERLEDLESDISEFFIITNIETLRDDRIIKQLNSGKNKIDMIIFDECHCAKSPSASQTKGLLKLKDAKYKVAATGTLLLNNPVDSYIPLHWIGEENCTFSNFKYYYCEFGGAFNDQLLGFRNTHVLKSQIEQCSLRRTKDLLDLPEKTIIDEYIDMNDDHRLFYDNIKNGVKDQVDKVNLNTATLLSMVTRLRQATACPSILTTENISSTKIDRCCELVQQIVDNGEKVVVFSTFKETLNPLYERLSQYHPTLNTGDVPDDIIVKNKDNFQEKDDSSVFLATWQKMGTGITLTRASYAIFLDTPWTAGVYEQAQDRIHRIGTKKPVFIYNLICKDSVDERVKEIVDDKAAISDYMIDDKISESSVNSLKKYIQEL